jgi:hypothetical protein
LTLWIGLDVSKFRAVELSRLIFPQPLLWHRDAELRFWKDSYIQFAAFNKKKREADLGF